MKRPLVLLALSVGAGVGVGAMHARALINRVMSQVGAAAQLTRMRARPHRRQRAVRHLPL